MCAWLRPQQREVKITGEKSVKREWRTQTLNRDRTTASAQLQNGAVVHHGKIKQVNTSKSSHEWTTTSRGQLLFLQATDTSYRRYVVTFIKHLHEPHQTTVHCCWFINDKRTVQLDEWNRNINGFRSMIHVRSKQSWTLISSHFYNEPRRSVSSVYRTNP